MGRPPLFERVMTPTERKRRQRAKNNSNGIPGPPEPIPSVTMTLRMSAPLHEQLREMAFVTRRSQQSLMLEALELLFKKQGRSHAKARPVSS